MTVLRLALFTLILAGVAVVLITAKGLLIPLVLAVFIFYLINILTDGLAQIPISPKLKLPRPLAGVASVIVLSASFWLLFTVLNNNARKLAAKFPDYRDTLQLKYVETMDRFQVPLESRPRFSEIFFTDDIQAFITGVLTGVGGFVSVTGLIAIYMLFMFLEKRSFNNKLRELTRNSQRAERTNRVLNQIDHDVRTYLGIKTATSALTGVLSYVLMRVMELDFASFWAVVIFLLNFIPTLGSIIATIFPTITAVVQYDTLWPVLLVGGGLTCLQFLIGSILEPRVMGDTLNLSPLVILISLGLWGAIWGIPGAVLAVPITVMCTIVCSYFPSTRPIAIILSRSGQLKNLD